jgi:hypothetical protein
MDQQLLNTLGLIILALLNIYALHRGSKTQALVLKIEQATNSMKDALVEATAKASHAEGLAEGKSEKANG